MKLETRTCGRCLGSGRFGPTCVANGICFGCRGKGEVLTKRGHAAALYLEALRSKPAKDLSVGDEVRTMHLTTGAFGLAPVDVWATIVSIETTSVLFNGKAEVRLAITTASKHFGRMTEYRTPEEAVRVRFRGEEGERTLALALAYQETLTKTGTVRKRPKANGGTK